MLGLVLENFICLIEILLRVNWLVEAVVTNEAFTRITFVSERRVDVRFHGTALVSAELLLQTNEKRTYTIFAYFYKLRLHSVVTIELTLY